MKELIDECNKVIEDLDDTDIEGLLEKLDDIEELLDGLTDE